MLLQLQEMVAAGDSHQVAMEDEQHRMPPMIRQPPLAAIRSWQLNIGSLCANSRRRLLSLHYVITPCKTYTDRSSEVVTRPIGAAAKAPACSSRCCSSSALSG